MKTSFSYLILALPILTLSTVPGLAPIGSTHFITNKEPSHVYLESASTAPFKLAARDGREEDCHWLGTCPKS